MQEFDAIREGAHQLPPEERLRLACELLQSLSGNPITIALPAVLAPLLPVLGAFEVKRVSSHQEGIVRDRYLADVGNVLLVAEVDSPAPAVCAACGHGRAA